MQEDTWATLLVLDYHRKKVLVERFLAFTEDEGVYVLSNPPVEITIVQTGKPMWIELRNLREKTIKRMRYRDAIAEHEMLNVGDVLRVNRLHVKCP